MTVKLPGPDGDPAHLDPRGVGMELARCELVRLENAQDAFHAGHLVELGCSDGAVVAGDAADRLDRSPAQVRRVAERLDLAQSALDLLFGGVFPEDKNHGERLQCFDLFANIIVLCPPCAPHGSRAPRNRSLRHADPWPHRLRARSPFSSAPARAVALSPLPSNPWWLIYRDPARRMRPSPLADRRRGGCNGRRPRRLPSLPSPVPQRSHARASVPASFFLTWNRVPAGATAVLFARDTSIQAAIVLTRACTGGGSWACLRSSSPASTASN